MKGRAPRNIAPQSLVPLVKGREVNDHKRYSYTRIAQVVRIMMTGGHTIKQLQQVAGLSQSSAYNFVRAFHSAGCMHIIGYERATGNRLGGAIYKWGVGDDAPMPKPVTNVERARRSKQTRAAPTIDTLWPIPIRRNDNGPCAS